MDLAQNRLTSFPLISDDDAAGAAPPSDGEEQSNEPTSGEEEVPDHVKGLTTTVDPEDNELAALGLNRPTRRLYRHWTRTMTYGASPFM